VRGEHLLDRSEGLATELARDGVGARRVGIDDSNQTHAAGLLKLLIDAGVIAPEGANADDGDVDGEIFGQISAPRYEVTSCESRGVTAGPQGLKPASFLVLGGTAEAVPFPKSLMRLFQYRAIVARNGLKL
jgi:hypothetical protein